MSGQLYWNYIIGNDNFEEADFFSQKGREGGKWNYIQEKSTNFVFPYHTVYNKI